MSGEKVNEEQVSNLLAILRTDATVDNKVNLINQIKSGIKQNNIPEPCIQPIFEATRIAMISQQTAIVNAGFTTLGHLLSRLSRQEPKYIVKEAGRMLPLIIEKMGDSKEKYRQLAAQCLTTYWDKAQVDVERIIKNVGLTGKNAKMKESCITWIVQMHQEHSMPFKNYVSALMILLEDADGMVRDVARNSVITLFQNASNTAKSDLKRQLKEYNIRPTISSTIIGYLAPASQHEVTEPSLADVHSKSVFSYSVSSAGGIKPSLQVPEVRIDYIDPAYVNTQRELEDMFHDMHPYFEGKESEHNWLKREQSCTMIRRLNSGNAPIDFLNVFLAGIKALLDGILKAVNSLRTSLSKEGCSVVQEIVKTAGTGMDPMVEILLQNLIKLCGGTKKISSQQGNVTVDIIISKVSYNIRLMQHIWAACQDKNVQPRTYATGWLKTLLDKESHHKSHIEHTGGLDLIEKCIKKGLTDANPGVRESMRSTYWKFAQIWPTKAEVIRGTLDATQQKLLDNVTDNPNPSNKVLIARARPGSGLSKSTTIPPKPSLRDTVLAQKKAAMAQKVLPTRPGSAMSSFSPSQSILPPTASDTLHVRMRPDLKTHSHGGLSVAPMRPTRFKSAPRPELVARPATAGPYSVRRPGHKPSNSDSSNSSIPSKPQKASTPIRNSASPAQRYTNRPSTSHSLHAYQSNQSTPIKNSARKSSRSPRISPCRSRLPSVDSTTKTHEEITLVVPYLHESKHISTPKFSSRLERSSPPVKSTEVYEDPFSSGKGKTKSQSQAAKPVIEKAQVKQDSPKANQNKTEEFGDASFSSESTKMNSPLLESGINKVKAKSLDIHGFRKLQGILRESDTVCLHGRFSDLLSGLFDYLRAPLTSLSPEKVQDVKTQVLATINIMLKKDREAFRPFIATGLESLLIARSAYDSRAYIVSGLEILSTELIMLAEPSSTVNFICAQIKTRDTSPQGCRGLSMGLHILKELLSINLDFHFSEVQLANICALVMECLDSNESGVRMDAVQLSVAIHTTVGDKRFWEVLDDVREDPKSLIAYYIMKQQLQKEYTGPAIAAL
ncbi:CLIP-associated protein [Blumeria hordei DH14]|uniref:CLIP-associated protein n=1 Tax=Blumeria graminis f. sp. hordei (strain DH14) TaxID=546991 RepID=N1J8W3_BLUG1|nr:CLIP-associated protein [Blumeria hordei DH14]